MSISSELQQKIAKSVEEAQTNKPISTKDTNSITLISAESETLKTKSCSGAPVCKWSIEELISKIWQSIIILEANYQTVNQSNVLRLLGFDKSTIYRINNDKVQLKVADKINKIIGHNVDLKVYKIKDPTLPEHIVNTMGSLNLGSKPNIETLHIPNNQRLLSLLLQPIFNDNTSESIKVGYGEIKITPKEFMVLLLMRVLIKNKWFHGCTSKVNIHTYVTHLNECISQTVSKARISSKNASFDYLARFDKHYKFSKLIERYGNYLVGQSAYHYKLTPLMEEYISEAVESMDSFDIELFDVDEIKSSDLVISKEIFHKLHPRDIYLMFNHFGGVDSEGNYIIKNSKTIMDYHSSRVYSLMTSLKSTTRKEIGFINYDVSTCMQTIVSHYVDMSKYPRHQELIDDKRSFRQKIAKELNIVDIAIVKEMLSASDNGKEYKNILNSAKTFKEYMDETESMVDEFINHIEINKPKLIEKALLFAKPEFELVDWVEKKGFKKKQPKFEPIGPKKYSLFFFIWTQIEREIRHAMISCFKGFVHEVHDAVYSKEVVDTKILEFKVYGKTGIRVKIEN